MNRNVWQSRLIVFYYYYFILIVHFSLCQQINVKSKMLSRVKRRNISCNEKTCKTNATFSRYHSCGKISYLYFVRQHGFNHCFWLIQVNFFIFVSLFIHSVELLLAGFPQVSISSFYLVLSKHAQCLLYTSYPVYITKFIFIFRFYLFF